LTINLFYEEPDPDRWIKFDRFPRRLIRRLFRGKSQPGGQAIVALGLMKGLDLLNIPYRFNDYNYARKNPDELIGLIGKTHLLYEKKFKNPIVFGASIFSHPLEYPGLLEENNNIKQILVPGNWMKKMFEPFFPGKVANWPVGIDTEKWSPKIKKTSLPVDYLIYDKIRWNHDFVEYGLIKPILHKLQADGYTYEIIRYGHYNHDLLMKKLSVSKATIFLCEHETQGLAYQQILATGTPIFAYDRQEYWLDPEFYPHRVKFGPVSSVPYWDDRCGLRFKSLDDFEAKLEMFNRKQKNDEFSPRSYITENLSLEIAARNYYDIYSKIYRDTK